MNDDTTVVLERECDATMIPDGITVKLSQGTRLEITQALGGSVTVRTDTGLFRIGRDDLDALGESAVRFQHTPTTIADDRPFSEERVWEALRECFDPEIPINIVDLGLIYDLRLEESADKHRVYVKMTLTAQGCGMGPAIAADAEARIKALPTVEHAEVAVVWDPQWTPQMISPEGRKVLGLD